MKKVSIAAVFLILVSSLSSCLNDDGTNFDFEYFKITDAEVPDTIELGKDHTLDISYIKPSNCHTLYDISVAANKEESTDSILVVEVALAAQVQISDECSDVNSQEELSIDDFSISNNPPTPKRCHLKFFSEWDSAGEPIFLTYDIPVKEEE